MNKPLIISLILGLCHFAAMVTAQTYSLSELRKWPHSETLGDLNKDGVKDLVIIATPDNKEHFIVTEDEDTVNANKPILAIFKGSKNGSFSYWRLYEDALPIQSSSFVIFDFSLTITDRGTLQVSIDSFATAGTWYSNTVSYVYRFQNGDFYLIGEDNNSYMRNTGDGDTYSYNYLTHKKQHVKYNIFDESVKPKESWSNLPKTPLKKLGSFTMGDS